MIHTVMSHAFLIPISNAAVQGASVPRVYEYRGVPRDRQGAWTGTGIADRDNPYADGAAVAQAEDDASMVDRYRGPGKCDWY